MKVGLAGVPHFSRALIFQVQIVTDWVFGYFTHQLQGIERAVLISALTLYGSGPVQRYYLLSSFFLSDDKKQRSPTSDFSLKEFLKNEHNYLFVLETA